MTDAERLLIELLIRAEIITPDFQGDVTIKISAGCGISDIHRTEKGLKHRLKGKKCLTKPMVSAYR